MKKMKLINETNDKFIEEIVTKVLVKYIKDNEFLDEVRILGEDEDKGEIYLSSEDTKYTVLVENVENNDINKYYVSWTLYKENNLDIKDRIEIVSGEDTIKFIGLFKEEDYECVEFKVFNSNINDSYIIGNVDSEYFFNKGMVEDINGVLNERHFINVEFEEYLEKHNISNVKFLITPYGESERPNRIQFEITETYDGCNNKAVICLRKINEETGEFKFDERYLAYEESHGQSVLKLIMDFMEEYYVS